MLCGTRGALGVSKATAGRYLKKLNDMGYLSVLSFPGTHGSALYLNNYLSTMFEVSDVLIDKDEVAMVLHIGIEKKDIDEMAEENDNPCVSEQEYSVSNPYIQIAVRKVCEVLAVQGFPCVFCPKVRYKLLPLSYDCEEQVLVYREIY